MRLSHRDRLYRNLAALGAKRGPVLLWREIYVYFMHEPTAPANARTLMQYAT